ncbi:HD-GYP domain-containing protein [Rhodoferax ferrireducens]|uniref:HD-GYP domain-containing protein n=1 Tax=Rhodoferax ferrireducens TaxID=192843 RepID=UPI000E0D5E80|nr:HD-GYP domain-containing protein [Rhodoferax ferrireducens]
MNEAQTEFIEVHQLQIGMFIELELGWMSHPFPKGSFKISSDKQIVVIQELGLKRIRYVPGKSELADRSSGAETIESESASISGEADGKRAIEETNSEELHAGKQSRDLLAAQQRNMAMCERRFAETIREHKLIVALVSSKPREAMEQCLGLVNTVVGEMLGEGDSAIRLLSEGMGDKASMHPVNVTIISLLLGKALRLSQADLVDLGMAAFLHDIGKSQLPDRVRWLEENFSSSEYKLYQDHVGQSITLAKRMDLTSGALQAIAQHHELVDGSGFPIRLKGDGMSLPAKILALVNRYENLCNPSRPAAAITPHEALSLIFAQLKTRYDGVALSAFIRMMGVYPPGSIVQLADERFALVVSVNSSRPLKPRVLVHDPHVSRHEALILDLEHAPNIGIRRSLKPASLPKAAMEYLSPRQRVCYFFEQEIEPPLAEVGI